MRHLADHHCVVIRDDGPHTVVRNLTNGAQASIPRHREIKNTTARSICRQLNIPPPPEK